MGDRLYRILMGICVLIALYLEMPELVLGIVAVMYIEGVTNWRLPIVVGKLNLAGSGNVEIPDQPSSRIPFDAERALRLVAATFLFVSIMVFSELLWWVPWFMGFAFFFAGLSGICPMLLTLKFIGFR